MLARKVFEVSLVTAIGILLAGDPSRDRRNVDTVIAGNAESEAEHGYAGHDDVAGVANDTTFRQARGWMRYAVTTFDDTEVTVACTFAGNGSAQHYDLVVEDSLVASRTFTAPAGTSAIVEIKVPFVITKGRTNVAVTLRGRNGPTPALRELRIFQDHHQFFLAGPLRRASAAVTSPAAGSQTSFGVGR